VNIRYFTLEKEILNAYAARWKDTWASGPEHCDPSRGLYVRQGSSIGAVGRLDAPPTKDEAKVSLVSTPVAQRGILQSGDLTRLNPGSRPARLGSSSALKSWAVETNGGLVYIKLSADLFEGQSSHYYLWALLVINPTTNQVISQKLYEDQSFTVPPGTEMTPTFDDWIGLNPGRYRVDAALYRLPKGFDTRTLNEWDVAKAQICAKAGNVVTIRE
jgi:hypothetical protein